jgi:UDP-2-acetamido-3-amino-2,3-dideoxy-glucuronate N-acetyltransferase
VHSHALVETDRIGAGTRVWAFAHVMEGATVGADCNLGDHVFVESGVAIGNGVTLKNGVAVYRGVHLADGVFVGPNAVFTNDRRPRSRGAWTLEATRIEEGATIGANATIRCGITIGRYAFVAAGAVVTADVAAHALVAGNPARRRGWVCRCGRDLRAEAAGAFACEACERGYREHGGTLHENE